VTGDERKLAGKVFSTLMPRENKKSYNKVNKLLMLVAKMLIKIIYKIALKFRSDHKVLYP
jgi:hypothetical protein